MPAALEALFGAVLVYIGVRFVIAGRVPVTSEGGTEVLAWITGRPAIALGLVVACAGGVLLVDAGMWGGRCLAWLTRP